MAMLVEQLIPEIPGETFIEIPTELLIRHSTAPNPQKTG